MQKLVADDAPPRLWVVLLLALPWVQPWAPGPQSNTVPLLLSWATLAIVPALGRWPSAGELTRGWAIAAVISSAMGLLQYFGEASKLGGWVHVPAYLGDALGNLRQRNQLATLTSIGAVAVLWWHRQGLSTAHAVWMLALIAAGNAATGSRTGLLQWLLLPALCLLWQTGTRQRAAPWSWPLLIWALMAYLLAGLALPQALATWSGAEVNSAVARMGELDGCGSRSVLWRNVLYLISQKPWTGWGWGELKYAHYMTEYPGPRFCDILGHAHNLPLHLAFAFGVPAALVLCAGLLAVMLRARPWRVVRPSDPLGWGVLSMVGLHSLLEYPLWYGPFQVATLLAVLLLWPQAVQSALRRPLVLRAAGWCTLTLSLLIGADYLRLRQVYLPHEQRIALWQDNPWAASRRTLFFGQTFLFAEVTSRRVNADNAQAMLQSSLVLLHYSPEPRVIDKLIESARMAGQPELAAWHEARKAAVYGASPRRAD